MDPSPTALVFLGLASGIFLLVIIAAIAGRQARRDDDEDS